jgi:sugar lactone lactonase YvrE
MNRSCFARPLAAATCFSLCRSARVFAGDASGAACLSDSRVSVRSEVEIAEAVPRQRMDSSFVLEEVARSERLWTGVAVSKTGRIFVNYPRWTGDGGISVAEIAEDSSAKPFPNIEWNQWSESDDPARRFVCVQSVYVDDEDDLWVLDPASPMLRGVVPGGAKLVRIDLSTDSVVDRYPLDSAVAPRGSYLNDVRVDTKRRFAYISESGEGSIVAVDLRTGAARRVLAGHHSAASEDTVIVVEGVRIAAPVNCDGIALDPKREHLYYQALRGRTLYRISTRLLRDFETPDAAFTADVGAACYFFILTFGFSSVYW